MKKINVYWCDDEYAVKVGNREVYQRLLIKKNIKVKSFSKSEDLIAELQKPNISNHVDAVIFDFNMSNIGNGRPDVDEKSGFLDILRHMEKYAEQGIQFFLWSKMDFDTIRGSLTKSSDYKKELTLFDHYINEDSPSHFFGRGVTFETLLDTVISEVESNKTSQAMLRRKYPEAYDAAMSISQKCWDDIVTVLTLTPDSDNWYRMEDLINPLRCHVEKFMDSLGIPSDKGEVDLNSLGVFISGSHDNFSVHENLVDPILGYGITNLMSFINDGSHHKETLKKKIRAYLIEKKDEHLLYYIAHSLINLLIWANKARKLKEEGEIIYTAKTVISPEQKQVTDTKEKNINPTSDSSLVSSDGSISGILEQDEKGYLHIGECQVFQWRVGQKYKISKENLKENSSRHSGYKYFTYRIE